MKNETPVGVVVGRFQVPDLHPAHREFIDEVSRRHDHLIILVGVHPFPGTRSNPLDFPTRHHMLQQLYPNAIIMPIRDVASDDVWSTSLDNLVRGVFPFYDATLYGGRDSAIAHYQGKLRTCEMLGSLPYQGTDVRAKVHRQLLTSADARAGAIYLAGNTYPKVYPTVDIAVVREVQHDTGPPEWELLMVQKPGERGWRFPGGFVDPSDKDLETAARREVGEEVGIEVSDLQYVGTWNVLDWRCTDDKIMTTLFTANYVSGAIEALDDLKGGEVRWHPFHSLEQIVTVKTHEHLLRTLFMGRCTQGMNINRVYTR